MISDTKDLGFLFTSMAKYSLISITVTIRNMLINDWRCSRSSLLGYGEKTSSIRVIGIRRLKRGGSKD